MNYMVPCMWCGAEEAGMTAADFALANCLISLIIIALIVFMWMRRD